MKRLPVLVFALLAATGATFCPAQTDSPNLVRNSSLEEAPGENGLPRGWFPFSKSGSGYESSIAGAGRTDRMALLLEGQGAAGEYGGVITNAVEIDRSKRYVARGYVKFEGEPGSFAMLKLDYTGADGQWVGSTYPGKAVGVKNPDWNVVSLMDRLDEFPDAKHVRIACALNGKGKAWFDDLELVARNRDQRGNLLPDGSMECVVGLTPSRWQLTTTPGGKGVMEWMQDPVKDGWYSLLLRGNAQALVAGSEKVVVEKGKTYTLTGWARAKSGAAELRIAYFKDPNVYLGFTASEPVKGKEWEKRTLVADLAKFPQATKINATGAGTGGEIEVGFDGFVLTAK